MIVWQAHKSKVRLLAFAPDGSLATATGSTKALYLWDAATGKLARQAFTDWPDGRGAGMVHAVGFAPAAPLVALGTDRSTSVWDARTWEAIADLHLDLAVGVGFGFGPTGSVLVAAHHQSVAVWADAARPTGEQIRFPDRRWDVDYGVSAMDVSPDGSQFATVNDLAVTLWAAGTGRKMRSLPHPRYGACRAVRFSPDGSRLAVARGMWVDVWDAAAGEVPVRTIRADHARPPVVRAVGWADAGRVLLTAGADGFARLWDAGTGKELRSFAWGIGKVHSAAFAPDGLTCAAGGANGQVVIWDVD